MFFRNALQIARYEMAKDTYREQLVVRLSKDDKRELREAGVKFSLRISDFARVALREGLRQIQTRGVIEKQAAEQEP
jgi:hypothetical protein